MSKTWNFDQPLDDVKPTSSHEERAKIAALFHKQDEKSIEEVDYVATFEQQQKESESKDVQMPESKVKQNQPKKVNITSDSNSTWQIPLHKITRIFPPVRSKLKNFIN